MVENPKIKATSLGLNSIGISPKVKSGSLYPMLQNAIHSRSTRRNVKNICYMTKMYPLKNMKMIQPKRNRYHMTLTPTTRLINKMSKMVNITMTLNYVLKKGDMVVKKARGGQ